MIGMKKDKEFSENTHYYLEEGRVVFTALFHLERGQCCGNRCRHCPYTPEHQKNTAEVKKEFAHLKKDS